MRGKNKQKAKRKSNKVITSSVIKITTLFVFVAIVAMLYQNSMTSNIVADNNRQRAQEKLETVKGSKLKIGDYVNYDHTLQVDPNTKETTSVPKNKLTYTSVKGDLINSGNGIGTQTVDVSGYKTKWRVYDIQGDQVLLMPETQPTAEIKVGSALGYLWYEKEAHNIAGIYGHGYGADETKQFNYEVGSRIPSERDTRTETKTGTGARPMLLKDIEEAYGIITDERRQELNDYWDKERDLVGSNNLTRSIYYPTLNKSNARATEEKIDEYGTGDIGVSKTTKKLTDIKNEYYGIDNLDKVHTKTYDVNTGKDAQKEIIHKYFNTLGSRSFQVDSNSVSFYIGCVYSVGFYSGLNSIGNSNMSYFDDREGLFAPRPVVFLSSANNYYKEQGNSEYATYSLIKEENEESQNPKIQNPYNVSLKNVSLKGTYADRLLFESKLEAPTQDVAYTNFKRADGTKVIDNITYTVEGLPEGITYDVVKKEVSGKEEVTIQIYPKELSVVVNINKEDIYDGAKFNYDILLDKNGTNVSTKQLNEIADGKVEIAKYTEKKDIIDEEGNAVNYTLNFANFNDTVRKNNDYYDNSLVLNSKENNPFTITYDLNIVYLKDKYAKDISDILDKIEKEANKLSEDNKNKKEDITKLEEEVGIAEKNKGTDELGKKKLEEELENIKEKENTEKEELKKLEEELEKVITNNNDVIEGDKNLKKKKEQLEEKITGLKATIEKDDEKIKDLEDRIGKIKVLYVTKIEELEKKVKDLEEKNKKNESDIEENKKTIKNLNDLIEKLKKDNKDAVDKITKEKEDLENKNQELEEENKKLKETITELQAEIEQLKGLEQDNKGLKNKIADLEGEILEAEAKVNDLKEKLEKCGKHGKELEEKIEELEKTIKEQDEKIKKLEQEKEDLEKRNKELEEKNKLNEEELKEKELLEKKIKELEEKVKTLEAEKEKLAKEALDKKEKEEKKNKPEKENAGEVIDANANASNNKNNNKPSTRNNAVASNSKKNNSKNNVSNNKIPHAGAGSVIMLTIITAVAIVYTKKVMKK